MLFLGGTHGEPEGPVAVVLRIDVAREEAEVACVILRIGAGQPHVPVRPDIVQSSITPATETRSREEHANRVGAIPLELIAGIKTAYGID